MTGIEDRVKEFLDTWEKRRTGELPGVDMSVICESCGVQVIGGETVFAARGLLCQRCSQGDPTQKGEGVMKRFFLVAVALSLLTGCSHFEGYTYGPMDLIRCSGNRKYIRVNHFYTGMYRRAFFKEWGLPDKTSTEDSSEFASSSGKIGGGWTGQGGGLIGESSYFSETIPFDVWIYSSRGVVLVFNQERLVSWKTEKTRQQIESPQKGGNESK